MKNEDMFRDTLKAYKSFSVYFPKYHSFTKHPQEFCHLLSNVHLPLIRTVLTHISCMNESQKTLKVNLLKGVSTGPELLWHIYLNKCISICISHCIAVSFLLQRVL